MLPFFNAQYPGAESGYGAQCKYVLRNKDASGVNTNVTTAEIRNTPRTPQATMSSRDQRRLSLGNVQARSFNRSEPSLQVIQQKGYKTFHPGVYEYYFEITMDHKSPETINLPMGGVKWMFDALIERSGTFKPNLHGVQELTVVRAPDPNSLTEVEPIAITRKWEDQLHYEIVISGKSFPLGGKIPIALKLTPLAKVQCHRVRFFVTENVEYYCRNKKVTRKDVQRKLLLFEKLAHQPLAPEYTGSTFKSIAGGEKTARERDLARQTAENCRKREAERNGTKYTPLPPQADNILGDLELGLDHLNIQSEIEMEVQLPTCARMKSDKTYLMHPDTSYPNIRVHHWLKVIYTQFCLAFGV